MRNIRAIKQNAIEKEGSIYSKQFSEERRHQIKAMEKEIENTRKGSQMSLDKIHDIKMKDRDRFQTTYKAIRQFQFDSDMLRINLETKSIYVAYRRKELESLNLYKNNLIGQVIILVKPDQLIRNNIGVEDILTGLD